MPEEHEARWDAQTLAEAEVIRGDATRHAAAKGAAAKLAQEEAEKVKAMKKVATGRKGKPGSQEQSSGTFIPGGIL